LHSTFDLIKSYGFTDTTLTSKNAIIPIVYYLYHRNIYLEFHKKKSHEKDRDIIKKWLHIVLIKRIFGGQADTILAQIRTVFTKNVSKKNIDSSIIEFPYDLIIKELKGTTKDMTFDDDYIENLLLTQKNDPLCFSILAILYPHLDYRNGDFHKDHILQNHYSQKENSRVLEYKMSNWTFTLIRLIITAYQICSSWTGMRINQNRMPIWATG